MKIHAVRWFIVAMTPIGLLAASAAGQEGKDKVVPAKAELSPLDPPLAMLYEARRNYTAVKDYTCILDSQERVRGKLGEPNIMQFKMKTEPFSVYMRWLTPKSGQEVAFVLGKNNNKMRVRSTTLGQGKFLGFLSIDPNDKRVLEHSRHNIMEAGIGNMIEQNIRHWEAARKIGKTAVRTSDFRFNGRDCIRIEVTATERNMECYCFRSVIYLEKSSKLPVRLENYDWPCGGGPAGGDLLESFSYRDLRFNTGLTDAEFGK